MCVDLTKQNKNMYGTAESTWSGLGFLDPHVLFDLTGQGIQKLDPFLCLACLE